MDFGNYPFRPIGFNAALGVSVWPIEEYLARTKHRPTVRERIRRLNPAGKAEGERPRGWHPASTFGMARWSGDLVRSRDFDRRWGKGAFGRLPKAHKVRLGGRRFAVTFSRLLEGPA